MTSALDTIKAMGTSLSGMIAEAFAVEPESPVAEVPEIDFATPEALARTQEAQDGFYVSDPETGESYLDPMTVDYSATNSVHAASVTVPATSPTEPSMTEKLTRGALAVLAGGVAYVLGVPPGTATKIAVATYDATATPTQSAAPASHVASEDDAVCESSDTLLPGDPLFTGESYYDVDFGDGTGQCFEDEESARQAIEMWQASEDFYANQAEPVLTWQPIMEAPPVAPTLPIASSQKAASRSTQAAPTMLTSSDPAVVESPLAPTALGYTYYTAPQVLPSPESESVLLAEAPVQTLGVDPVVFALPPDDVELVAVSLPVPQPHVAQTRSATAAPHGETVAQESSSTGPVESASMDTASRSGESQENTVLGQAAENFLVTEELGDAIAMSPDQADSVALSGHDPETCCNCLPEAGAVGADVNEDVPVLSALQETTPGDDRSSPVLVSQPLTPTRPKPVQLILAGVTDVSAPEFTEAELEPTRRRASQTDVLDPSFSPWGLFSAAWMMELREIAAARDGQNPASIVYIPAGAMASMGGQGQRGTLGLLLDLLATRADVARPVTVVTGRGQQDFSGQRQGENPDNEVFFAENVRLGTKPYSTVRSPGNAASSSVRGPSAQVGPADVFVTSFHP